MIDSIIELAAYFRYAVDSEAETKSTRYLTRKSISIVSNHSYFKIVLISTSQGNQAHIRVHDEQDRSHYIDYILLNYDKAALLKKLEDEFDANG